MLAPFFIFKYREERTLKPPGEGLENSLADSPGLGLQKLAQEAGFRAPQPKRAAPAMSLGQAISQRSQTVPSNDLLRALESIRQVAQKPALAPKSPEDTE